MRERTCIVSGKVLPQTELIRFVAGPDDQLFVDIRAKAPGRGVWVSATQDSLQQAIKRKGFARGLKTNVQVPPDLIDQVQAQLSEHCLGLMGMARKSGQLVNGFEKVRSAIRSEKPGWLIEAKDGAADGRHKVLALCKGMWEEVPLVGCFDATALGSALGNDAAGHVLMRTGAIATQLGLQLHRLSGFTPIIPVHWTKMGG
ncbi:COG2740: Predicted nucleic-acid-binding protein implicated in transcription termination / Ribosomal protein L7Ae family protein YlxQ [hydrothermal vent metagenome]|uniref:COG2740: Predicted nucleic-acid-binding protein implicated in transcription termination / Ribosomal protein L7Ae family protein YlxQ n=1 Tax=hydrothermal vent metagenome TaxID=652676 RepID=A0A3B0R3R7_9ZZZZ